MLTAVDCVIDFIEEIMTIIPDSPFMFLFALAVVLILLRSVYEFVFFSFKE